VTVTLFVEMPRELKQTDHDDGDIVTPVGSVVLKLVSVLQVVAEHEVAFSPLSTVVLAGETR
jgi:hypothetical protein